MAGVYTIRPRLRTAQDDQLDALLATVVEFTLPGRPKVAPGPRRALIVQVDGQDAGLVYVGEVAGASAWIGFVTLPDGAEHLALGAFASRAAAEETIRRFWRLMGASVSEIPQEVRKAIYNRDQGRCRRCGKRGESIHHRRKRRSANPHRPSNLVLLCGDGTRGCHGWIEANPKLAAESGWHIRMDEPDESDEILLTDVRGGTVVLLDDFNVLPFGHMLDRIRR